MVVRVGDIREDVLDTKCKVAFVAGFGAVVFVLKK